MVLFMRDSGRSLQVVHYIPSPNSQKTIRPRDEVIDDESNDEMMMKTDGVINDEIMMKLL